MPAAEFDPEVLTTAVERQPVLSALAEEPHHRKELQTALDLSKTTCHRIIRTFDDRGLLRRTDSGYELTRLGEIVHEQVESFDATVRTAYRLRPLVAAFDEAGVDFEVELFLDARITVPEPGDPYPFADRTMDLFRSSDTIRIVDCNQLVPPLYVEKMLDIAIETGMRGEFIITGEIARGNVEQFPERQRAVAEGDAAGEYRVHDDITFGMAIYDDHLDLRAYDEETGTPVLYVDTDDPDAIAWAENVYARYYEESRPATDLDGFPDWAPDSGIESDE
ncbi:transcriptional regulator [Halobacteriales archaeon QH_7_66_37]|nr:MAG: transcriptional regulator [Halobacteriales archaeon QH_7_66_37]